MTIAEFQQWIAESAFRDLPEGTTVSIGDGWLVVCTPDGRLARIRPRTDRS